MHFCWTEDQEEMEIDHMFYHFKDEKLIKIDPPFLMGPYSPLLCRALRYGMCLKLEEMFAQYSEVDSFFKKSK